MSFWNPDDLPDTRSWKEQLEDAYKRVAERNQARLDLPQRSHSSFWLDESVYESVVAHNNDPHAKTSPEYALKLNSIRRAIANFVRIVTGKDIPVKFSTGTQSYAVNEENHEFIVISATDDPDKFDINVGLALHEGAHMILSRPTPGNADSIPLFELIGEVMKHPGFFITPNAKTQLNRLGLKDVDFGNLMRLLVNVMEDRRIDGWMYQHAIGYRGYYDAMYDAYWHSNAISELLMNPLSRRPTVNSYALHIINMTNEAANRGALPGLSEIYDLIDLSEINRFVHDPHWTTWKKASVQDTNGNWHCPIPALPEMARVAIAVIDIILANSERAEDIKVEDFISKGNGDGPPKAGEPDDDNFDVADESETAPDAETQPTPHTPDDASETSSTTDGNDDEEDATQTTDPAIEKKFDDAATKFDEVVNDALKDQAAFVNNEQQKEIVDAELDTQLTAMEDAKAEMRLVGSGLIARAKVIVYHNLSMNLLSTKTIPFSQSVLGHPKRNGELVGIIEQGIGMGNVLAHQLRVMADESTLQFTRQNAGKLDRRLLASLGYENENVFYYQAIERLNPVLVHLSIDSSRSMRGEKWKRAVKLAVAMAKAAEKIRTLDVVISFRSGGDGDELAHILIAYDSRRDSFSKVTQLFPYLRANGGTPEGLCFEAVKDIIVKGGSSTTRKFFVNISDGAPDFIISSRGTNGDSETIVDYSGEDAWLHTSRQVQEIRREGVTVLSYFVHEEQSLAQRYFSKPDNWEAECREGFTTMYGKDARFIDVDAVSDITRTLNQAFLTT
jgi:hypothetical protein